MENTDHILKDAIQEPQRVNAFALRSYYMPSTHPPLRFYRHHIVEDELPDASGDTEISTGASSSGYIKIAPRTTTFDPSVVTLPTDSRGITRAAILKRNYRSRPGVRERERETERARKNKKAKIVPNEDVCFTVDNEDASANTQNVSISGVLHRSILNTTYTIQDIFTKWVPGKFRREANDKFYQVVNDDEIRPVDLRAQPRNSGSNEERDVTSEEDQEDTAGQADVTSEDDQGIIVDEESA